tara:strand:+ start:1488 stop:2189 length:702 start_codon:yes stop_codon:yes gene_type:complete
MEAPPGDYELLFSSKSQESLSQCIEDLSLKVGSTIITPIFEEIVKKRGGVGSATHVSEVTISNKNGNVLVYVGKTLSRPLLRQVETDLASLGAGEKMGFAIEAKKNEEGDVEAEVLFAEKCDFLNDLRHLHDWAEHHDRVGEGFVADMVTFFRKDIELRRRFARALLSSGKAMCEACYRVMEVRGENAAMQCSRCKQAFYCSRSCQRRAYSSHRRFCTPCPEAASSPGEIQKN